jgi:hypothetical protein
MMNRTGGTEESMTALSRFPKPSRAKGHALTLAGSSVSRITRPWEGRPRNA